MAQRTGLIAAVALALLGHSVALDWLADQWQAPSVLQAMGKPVLTRMIAPAEPAPPAPITARANATPERPPGSALQAASSAPAQATPTAKQTPEPPPVSTPAPAAIELPQVAPTQVAQASPTAAPPEPEPAQTLPSPPPPLPPPAVLPAPEPASLPTGKAVAQASSLDSWPTDTRLSYQLRGQFRGELYGDASVQWQREGNRYQVQVDMDIALFIHIRMTSQGEVDPTRLRPSVYEEIRRKKTRAVRLGEREVTLDDGRRLPRPAGVQDTASQFVDLAHRFASGLEPLQVGSSVSFWMARPGGVDLWTYDVAEEVTLHLPTLGAVQAFHLKPRSIATPRGNISAEMWFAPSLQYLPVRIRIAQGEDIHLDLMVDKIEQR